MTKQIKKIKNLLVIPLIASAILLSNPVLASNYNTQTDQTEIQNVTEAQAETPSIKKTVVGIVISTNENIIIVETKDNMEYTVDASHATIMQAGASAETNPKIVRTNKINVGDEIVVRGILTATD